MIDSRQIGVKKALYPDVPASLSSEPPEIDKSPKAEDAHLQTGSFVTPYLGLTARISQIWINRWTILLLLVLVRVVLLIAQLNENVADAKAKALSACTKVEDMGSSMASMPHYLSVGVNELAAGSIEKAIQALVQGLDLIMTCVQAMIFFYINFLTATYVCLMTVLIHGSLEVVASVTKDTTQAFNKVVKGATEEIKVIASGLENAIQKLTSGVEHSIFGNLIPDIPKVDFTKPLENLNKLDIRPDDFVKDIQRLNKNIPSFDDVQSMTKKAIAIPFDFARKALNESLGTYKFNCDVFPRAQKQNLRFCSDNEKIQDFFSSIREVLHKARTIFVVLLSIMAAIAMAPMAWFELRSWRRQRKHARLMMANEYDPMDVIYIASRPVTATCGIKIASRLNGRRQLLMRWCAAYATSLPAIFVLSLALAGFFSYFCQFILLKAVEKEAPALAHHVGGFAGEVVTALENVSNQWADDANSVVKGLNNDINQEILAYVTNATNAVNNTINVFVDAMQLGLETVFNDTILLRPIKSVLHCVIGIKIESVQKGLSWVHDHAHVNFSLFERNLFSKGANSSIAGDSDLQSFLVSPSSATTEEVTGTIDRVTARLYNGLVKEALISTGILLVYFIVVLLGLIRTLACMAVPDRNHAGGNAPHVIDDSSRSAEKEWHDKIRPVQVSASRPDWAQDNHGTAGDRKDDKKMTDGHGLGRRYLPAYE